MTVMNMSMIKGVNDRHLKIAIVAGSLTISYIIVKYIRNRSSKTSKKPLPPSIRSLPIVGSLPFLPKIDETHTFFLEQSYRLGPVISFKVGSQYTVILNNHDVIREAFVKRSLDFADRPIMFTDGYFNPKNKGFIGKVYDVQLKRYRQLTDTIFKRFGVGSSMMESRIHQEVDELIQQVAAHNGAAFNPKQHVCSAVLNVISGVLFAHRYGDSEELTQNFLATLHQLFHESFFLFSIEILPLLRFMPWYARCIRRTKQITAQLLEMIEREIDCNMSADAGECFISCVIREEGEALDHEQLLFMIKDMLLGGLDSTLMTLLWLVVFLANDLELQKRLQNDLDEVVQKGQVPSLVDKPRLPRIESMILETMRYKTMFPLGAPHCPSCDTEVGGYLIPKGTMILPNLYAAQMNRNFWDEPDRFKPNRFLDPESGAVINKDHMISFSLGKRSCPGESLARQQTFLFITGLLQRFDILPPEGQSRVEVQDVMADTLSPSEYSVRFVPRHS